MRSIKFRAWDTKKRKMLNDKTDVYFVVDAEGAVYRSKTCRDITDEYYWQVDSEPTDELIVMQFIGLHDKNGKEIFEGDILRSGTEIISCEFFEEMAMFTIGGFSLKFFDLDKNKNKIFDFEVIGNIYENPELLKEHHENNLSSEKKF